MKLSAKDWQNYISKLSRINKRAALLMQEYIDRYGYNDSLIEYAYGLVTKYGEAAGALAAEMYDSIAVASGKKLKPAKVAETASLQETAKAINGTIKNMNNTVPATVGRLVKRTAADTTLQNALRDRAKFAWIPHGDTCAFCIALASRGWQYMSKRALKNGHAEHIHANCDCEYAISFDADPYVEGYDPQKYADMYYGAEGNTPEERINSMRREFYAQNKAKGINPESSIAEEFTQRKIPEFTPAKNLKEAEEFARQFADDVNYKGFTLDIANDVNDALNTLTAKYPINNLSVLKQYGRQKSIARACFDSLEINGGKIGKNRDELFNLGRLSIKNTIRELESQYPSGNMPDSIAAIVEKYKNRLKFERPSVGDSVFSSVAHEYGHIIADQYYGMINYDYVVKGKSADWANNAARMRNNLDNVFAKATESGDIYKISSYASTDADEFFAECFAAHEMGEKLPGYINDMVEEVANGSAM